MPKPRDVMADLNPWWKQPFEVEDFQGRELYRDVQRLMGMPQILALTGLRRVGKTTLLLKTVEDAIQDGFDPQRILYFSFDEFRQAEIRDVLRDYEDVMGIALRDGRFLVLLDEVQKIGTWPDQLKALYDLHKGRVKFLVSGSESLFIRRLSKETLAGRMFEFKVEPLTFREYLAFRGAHYEPVGIYERELQKHLDEFILTQGFPELVGITDRLAVRKYLRENLVEKTLFADLPGMLGIKDVSVLESLLNILMEEPGQIIQYADLSREMGVSRQTLSNYLSHLEESFLVRKLYNYSRGRRKVERKLRKYYPAIVSVDLAFRRDDQARSRVLEWLLVNQSRAEFFWRDPYKHEVDMVLGKNEPLPIEVKHGRVATTGVEAFMHKFRLTKAMIVTRDREETRTRDGRTIQMIPAFKFLLRRAETS